MTSGEDRRHSSAPWRERMRRVVNGDKLRHEWAAPEDVVELARAHYLEAVEWMQESVLLPPRLQRTQAVRYMTGVLLKRYYESLHEHLLKPLPDFVGVLRCDHQADFRAFSEEGDRCLVLDAQSVRRMATYQVSTGTRAVTQDLGDSVTVYALKYHAQDQRWKISAHLQELPINWNTGAHRMQELAALPSFKGRG